MKMFVFEGTSEEITKVFRTLQPTDAETAAAVGLPEEASSSATPSEASDEETPPVSVQFARRVLTRRRLSDRQKAMLQTLYEAHPEWLPAATLHKATDCTPAQFAGVVGATGRRVARTAGYNGQALIEGEWNDETGWKYRIPDAVREALRLEGLVSQ